MNRFQKLTTLLLFLLAFSLLQYFFRGETHQSTVDELCTGPNVAKCVPPFVKFRQQYRISAKHNLTACAIEKNFSTFLTAIMCYLNDAKRFVDANRTLDRDIYDNRLCKNLNEFNEFKKVASLAKPSQLFAVIRHPIDRFISGFVDKCLREKTWQTHHHRCGGCRMNLTCFIDTMYTRMMTYSKHTTTSNVFFDDSHFFPQSWRCEFAQLISRYQILKLDDERQFFDQLLELLAQHGATDEQLVFINKSLQQKTAHSTRNSSEREKIEKLIKSNKWMMTRLVQMYYYDFLLFGYRLPQF